MKNFPTVLFLVKEIAKLERERSVFCPGLFREEGDQLAHRVAMRGCSSLFFLYLELLLIFCVVFKIVRNK